MKFDGGGFARRLRVAREEAGYTQRSAGSAIGLDQSLVSRIEGGVVVPSVDQFAEFCRMYRADPTYILFGAKIVDGADPRTIVETALRRLRHEDRVFESAAQARRMGLGEETWRTIANGSHHPSQASLDAMLAYLRSPRPESQVEAMREVLDRVDEFVQRLRGDLGIPHGGDR